MKKKKKKMKTQNKKESKEKKVKRKQKLKNSVEQRKDSGWFNAPRSVGWHLKILGVLNHPHLLMPPQKKNNCIYFDFKPTSNHDNCAWANRSYDKSNRIQPIQTEK